MRVAKLIGRTLALLLVVAVAAMSAWLWHSGYRVYIVHTGSMSPTYKPGTLVIDGPATGKYHPGEVITFRHSSLTTDVVSHRITNITPQGIIHTKGDANPSPDVWNIRPDQVRGTLLSDIPGGGYVLEYLKQPAGIGSIVTTIFAGIMLWGIFFTPEAAETAIEVADEAAIEETAARDPGDVTRMRVTNHPVNLKKTLTGAAQVT